MNNVEQMMLEAALNLFQIRADAFPSKILAIGKHDVFVHAIIEHAVHTGMDVQTALVLMVDALSKEREVLLKEEAERILDKIPEKITLTNPHGQEVTYRPHDAQQ